MPLNRVLGVFATIGVLAGAQSSAVDFTSHSKMSRRQLVDCMMQRMSAKKTMSYIDAAKACKDQIKTANDKLASNTQEKSVNRR